MNLTIRTFNLKLQYPFRIAYGSMRTQPTVIVELEQDGLRGYGEAPANSYYGYDIDRIVTGVESVRTELADCRLDDPRDLWEGLNPILGKNRFAQCAVGNSAMAQLLPLLDYVDMDSAQLLAEDVASGIRVVRGRCVYPERPGHGVALWDMTLGA